MFEGVPRQIIDIIMDPEEVIKVLQEKQEEDKKSVRKISAKRARYETSSQDRNEPFMVFSTIP